VVTRGPEAREQWFDDPRIDEDEVCHDTWYLSSGMNIFQRGHLVKRTDPSWGNADKAMKGQADTFHFLNCSPQHSKFNPNKSKWAGIEDWITNTSDDENIRVSVFSGPVFEDDDKPMHGIQIPKAFWKVVCWVEDSELQAVALLADQSDLIKGMSEAIGSEAMGEVPEKLQEFHTSVSHISEITGLDFGKLVDADIFTGAEALGGEQKKKIEEFEDIKLRRRLPA
jgi:endonuclease G